MERSSEKIDRCFRQFVVLATKSRGEPAMPNIPNNATVVDLLFPSQLADGLASHVFDGHQLAAA